MYVCTITQGEPASPAEGDCISGIIKLKSTIIHFPQTIWLWFRVRVSTFVIPCWRNIWNWLCERNQRVPNYPSPIKQLFDALDILKIFGGAGALLAVLENINLDEAAKKHVYTMLICCTFCLTAAHVLQEMIPVVAVAALLPGVGLVIAFFITPVSKLFHVHVLVLLLPFYSVLALPIWKQLSSKGIYDA